MSETKENVVEVGGGYVENEDFVPNLTDIHGTFNTSGVGAHHDPATVSPIFEADRKATAAQVKAALDPEDDSVDRSKVIFSRPQTIAAVDHEAEEESLVKAADATLADGPAVIGGPTPGEKEAAKSGDEGEDAAKTAQEKANAGGGATKASDKK